MQNVAKPVVVEMGTLQEKDFREFAAQNVVAHVRLEEREGGYEIYVQLTWKENEDLLLTTRKTPRVWTNLDRLRRYLKEEIGFKGRLFIDLR